MLTNRFKPRTVAGCAFIAAVAGTVAAVNPAASAGVLSVIQSAASCATTTACVAGANTKAGPGVSATSKTGTALTAVGVTGVSGIGSTGDGVHGNSVSGHGVWGSSSGSSGIGVEGLNTGPGTGVLGHTSSGLALYGIAGSGNGLKATSGTGTAILAQTTSGTSAISATGSSQGYGVNASGDVALQGQASSANGYGVYGISGSSKGYGTIGSGGSNGIGVYGSSTNSYGVQGSSSYGIAGLFSSYSGYAVYANTGGSIAVYALNSNGNGADVRGSYIGLLGRAPASAYPLVLTDTNSNVVFQVDGSGNVAYTGGLSHLAATVRGGTARSFSPNSTQPTVEDTGTAQLVRGTAVVRLDPTFAASIEPATAYRVFVTAGGETNVLYVVGKTSAGFVVRESHAGRSTVPFDYRIVATALGAAGQHMTMLSPAGARAFTARAPLPAVPAAPKEPARLPTLPSHP